VYLGATPDHFKNARFQGTEVESFAEE